MRKKFELNLVGLTQHKLKHNRDLIFLLRIVRANLVFNLNPVRVSLLIKQTQKNFATTFFTRLRGITKF